MKTATNHDTGERFRLDEQTNKWVPMGGGAMPPLGAEHPPRQALPPESGREMMREIIGGPIDALSMPVDAIQSALQGIENYTGLNIASDRPFGGSQRPREAAGLPRPTTPAGKAMNVLSGGFPMSAAIVRNAPKAVRGATAASEIAGNVGAAGGQFAGASMSDNPLIQAALALAGGTVAPGATAVNIGRQADYATRPDVRAAKRVQAATRPGQMVGGQYQRVGPEPVMGRGDVLADTSETARMELDRTYQRLPAEGRTTDEVRDFLMQRSAMAGEDLMASVGDNVYQASLDAIERQKRSASPVYQQAYAQNLNMTPELQRLMSQPAVRREWESPGLVRAAENAASAEGIPFSPDMVGGAPSVQGLDYLIKRFDAMINSVKRNPSPTDSLGDLVSIRRQLRAAVPDASPDLDRARTIFAGPARAEELIEQGQTFLRGTANQTTRELAELTPSEQALYRIGAIEALEERIGRLGNTHDVTKIFTNANAEKRMRALLPDPQDYDRFRETVERLANQQRTYGAVTGGSQTAQRLQGGPMDNELLGVVLDLIPKGQQAGRVFRIAGKNVPGTANVDDIVARALISRQAPAAPTAPPMLQRQAGFGFLPGVIPDEVFNAFSDNPRQTRR